MSHPVQDLDETVHQRTRLGILAVLSDGGRVHFGYVQEVLGLTDGNLSRHLRILEDAGYVTVEKGYEGRRPRTWAQITKAGRRAVAEEVKLLKVLVTQLEPDTAVAVRPRRTAPVPPAPAP